MISNKLKEAIQSVPANGSGNMEDISRQYLAFQDVEAKIKAKQAELDHLKKLQEEMSGTIADNMLAAGISRMELADGTVIERKISYYASTSQDRMDEIKAYLRSHNELGLLKPKNLKVDMGVYSRLPDDMKPEVEFDIHSSTLKAHIAKLAAEGKLDKETIDIFKVHSKASIIIKT